ncbi:MAG TPA: carboxylating nicotinate-nucleotide diphosphorylase [Patescibacteria group bacterium]|nr:carboxylating nicotinate-nucleotide diphosphorylase [Patescibacteria group bacterium]
MPTSGIHDSSVIRLVQIALREDIGMGDITAESIFSRRDMARATFLVKQDGIICGCDIAKMVFKNVDDEIEIMFSVSDGDFVKKGETIARMHGRAASLLTAERTALNFMQRMSGVATMAHTYSEAVRGTGAKILDTRKTIPAWRILDKYAVKTGGACNHRFGLFDMAMIKDNHALAAGSLTKAVQKCRAEIGKRNIKIEVETQDLETVKEALACEGVHRIMFDNFTPELMKEAVELVNGKVETEASGGITLENVRAYAETGVDFISIGALTHSVKALDISMDFELAK